MATLWKSKRAASAGPLPLAYRSRVWYDLSRSGAAYQDSGRTTLCASNSDPVGSLTDFSGNSLHCSQATAGSRVTYRTNAQNSLPAIQGGNGLFLSASITLSAPIAICAAFKAPSSLRNYNILCDSTVGAGNKMGVYGRSSGVFTLAVDQVSGTFGSNQFTSNSLHCIVANIGLKRQKEMYRNGSLLGVANAGVNGQRFSTTDLVILNYGDTDKNSWAWDGLLFEFFILPFEASLPFAQNVCAYLNSKWSMY